MIWMFDNFELDEANCVLRRNGEPITIRRRVYAVLHYLVTRSGVLVTKEELLANVWPGENTVEAVLPQNIAILRNLLDDTRRTHKYIQTVHGRGYRFIAHVESRTLPATAAPSLRVCIGRDHTITELRTLIQAASTGTGQCVVLQGDAGIGKTTLLEHVTESARAHGALVLQAHCQDASGSPSFWPWQQILKPLLSAIGRKSSAELATLLGEPTRPALLLSNDPRASSEARFRMFDAITALIAEAASARPIVLSFDDLHWADHASIELLCFAARELRRAPVVLLGTTRTLHAVAADTAQATLSAWLANSHVRLLSLNGLTPASTAELAHQVLGTELDPEWLRDVHEITEGNPFHVLQWARLVLDDCASGREASAPLRLRDVIELRIKRLGARCEAVLTRAAIIGRSFNVAVLDRLAECPRAELLQALGTAHTARLLQPRSNHPNSVGAYEFTHALIQEVLYQRVTHTERARLHFEVGCALEAFSGVDGEPGVHVLAHHFHQAAVSGDQTRAVHYCRLAAEQAFQQLAFEQAVTSYRAALSALALRLPVDELQRYDLTCRLGSALFRAGQDGNSAFLAAAEIARVHDRPDLLAEVVVAMQGWPHYRRRGRTDNPAFYPLLNEIRERVAELNIGRRSQLLCLLALNAPERSMTLDQQVDLSREGLALAREAAYGVVLFDALDTRLRLMGRPDETRMRLALSRELTQVAEQLGDRERRFQARTTLIQALLALGQLEEADRELERCVQLAEALNLPRFTLQVLRLRLQRALGDGRFEEVFELTQTAVALRGPALPSPHYLVSLYAWQTSVRVTRGDRAWAERHVLALATKLDESRLLRAHTAALLAACDNLEEARRCYMPLLQPEVLGAVDEDWLLMLVWIADAVIACADQAAARTVYAALLPHAELNVTHIEWLMYFGACDYWLGALASLLGEWQQASTHLVKAVELNGRLGARPAFAWSCYACARALLQLDPGSGAARALRARAQSIAQALQMEPLQRAIHKLESSVAAAAESLA